MNKLRLQWNFRAP